MSAAEHAFDPLRGESAEPAEFLPEPILPELVRQRVIALAAALLTTIPYDELPPALRKVAKFAPNRRARLGGLTIASQLSMDPVFRQRISARAVAEAGDLGDSVLAGVTPAAADPVEVAALAYLSRPEGWRDLLISAGEAVQVQVETAAVAELVREAEARADRAEHDRTLAKVEADKLRAELSRLRDEMTGVQQESRANAKTLREVQAALKRANELLAIEKGRAAKAVHDHDAELRKLRSKLADAEAVKDDARQAARDTRAIDEARIWLLLETIGQAAVGLRRELGLDPAQMLPADAVASAHAQTPGAQTPATRGLDSDDPARLGQLLALPKSHLIVDGYNVTKRGFAEMSLEQQRNRLVAALGLVAAQSGAEVTVVFDGAERVHGLPPAPRGVRVLFSHKGETADELIRRLVRAEPPGRPLVVVSSDREVADGVKRHGAYPMGSDSLLKRISRS
ncbi:RNA-binding protein [Rhizocola hellebori]|uniref:RNA-binding protein n=1 Tax=Rhizocola hellebori TaxID=1392758 RepID=A0A8J3VK80_9ACTN|nr:NYN domain-containing protein [Rhizocola hellebori]GIH08816.1 RNA-binding protein [Rhizocola hellebori]